LILLTVFIKPIVISENETGIKFELMKNLKFLLFHKSYWVNVGIEIDNCFCLLTEAHACNFDNFESGLAN